jgi:hypothetical protein
MRSGRSPTTRCASVGAHVKARGHRAVRLQRQTLIGEGFAKSDQATPRRRLCERPVDDVALSLAAAENVESALRVRPDCQ